MNHTSTTCPLTKPWVRYAVVLVFFVPLLLSGWLIALAVEQGSVGGIVAGCVLIASTITICVSAVAAVELHRRRFHAAALTHALLLPLCDDAQQ